jgi:predicted nucleotidyltransferase
MEKSAKCMDSEIILQSIRLELSEYQSVHKTPSLELCGAWVNGSYGAGEATESSDIDITLEVGTTEQEYDMSAVNVAHNITGLGGPVSTALLDLLSAPPDVSVIPSEKILSEAGIDAPSAVEHIKQTQKHGGYEKVYDLHSGETIELNQL